MNKLKEEVNTFLKIKKNKEKEEQFSKMVEAVDVALSKGVKLSEGVIVSNFSELIKHLSFEFPDSFKIENPEDIAKYIKFPESKFPEKFSIENLSDIAKYIKFPENKFPEEFRISNFSEIKTDKVEFPENVKKLSFEKTENFLMDIYRYLEKFSANLKKGIFVSNKKISEAIPVKVVDSNGFVNIPKLITNKEGRLLVEVDRVSAISGGGGGLTSIETEALVNLDKSNKLFAYVTQVIDDYTTANVTYFCKMKNDGTWLFVKLDETGNYPVKTFANVSNNPTMTTYDLAFASRTSLTYRNLNTIIL